MRWNEIVSEKLQHAMPLSARINPMTGMPDPKKAQSLIPPVPVPVDPGTAIQNALPQIAQVVQEPIGADTEEEIQRMRQLSGQ